MYVHDITYLYDTTLCCSCAKIVIDFFKDYGYKLLEMVPGCSK